MSPFDLFAEALWQFYRTGNADYWNERDDGYQRREDLGWYFTTYRDFLPIEKSALKFVRGRVLDVGCGAGRHSLYLQRRGLKVTAMDVSPRIVELARKRGVQDARVLDVARRLPFQHGEFDTVIMFGNNLGIVGTVPKFRTMLREFARITSPRGRILATTRMPSTTQPLHRCYLRQNLTRGRAIGQIRLRAWYKGKAGAWFDLLLLAPTDLMQLAAKAGWHITEIFTEGNFEDGYSVVLEKF